VSNNHSIVAGNRASPARSDALDHQVADVAAIDPGGFRHPGDRRAVAAIERERDAHPVAVVAADLKAVGAPTLVEPINGNAAVMSLLLAMPVWRSSKSRCVFMIR
jgi:hypothetical protein